MAKGVKTGGRDFEPGQSGNPAGRTPLPEDIKQGRKLNRIELERVLNELIYLTPKEIKARVSSPETPAIEVLAGMIIAKAIQSGDYLRFNFILDRLVGKPHDPKDDNKNVIVAYQSSISDSDLDARIQRYLSKGAPGGSSESG